ncbi:MAG: DotU family type IV/VI secretion system protein, partial [Planctomycetaceae bacterium]
MNERFLHKVAPPILYVLSVLEKIESSGGEAPPPAAIRPRIKQLVGSFNVRGHDEEAHNLAKSAIVFWIDEVLVNANWKFAKEWQNTPLELELYGTRSRAWRFFENAAEARSLENSDALEVFALCVANGFQGVYRSDAFDPETFVSA